MRHITTICVILRQFATARVADLCEFLAVYKSASFNAAAILFMAFISTTKFYKSVYKSTMPPRKPGKGRGKSSQQHQGKEQTVPVEPVFVSSEEGDFSVTEDEVSSVQSPPTDSGASFQSPTSTTPATVPTTPTSVPTTPTSLPTTPMSFPSTPTTVQTSTATTLTTVVSLPTTLESEVQIVPSTSTACTTSAARSSATNREETVQETTVAKPLGRRKKGSKERHFLFTRDNEDSIVQWWRENEFLYNPNLPQYSDKGLKDRTMREKTKEFGCTGKYFCINYLIKMIKILNIKILNI